MYSPDQMIIGSSYTDESGPGAGLNMYHDHDVGWRFATALLPRLFGKNPWSHHKGATGRVQSGVQLLLVLCMYVHISGSVCPASGHWAV